MKNQDPKNILITGAGRGIGLALTKEFVDHGYHVLATYRSEKSAKELLDLGRSSSSITTCTLDVSDSSSFGPLKNELKKINRIDILINNSGVIGDKGRSFLEMDLDAVSDVLAVNTLGPMRLCQMVIPFMPKGSTIAQITSRMGSIADNSSGGYYDYRMSKAALNMFNMSLSKDFPQLTCLTLHPGWVQTDMGGREAPVQPMESARGLYKVITSATSKQSGHFFDFSGKEIPW